MESWQPKEFNINNINGGRRYKDGDGVGAEAINAVVEASAYVQDVGKLGKNQPELIEEVGGSPSVAIQDNKFVFFNLKGASGKDGKSLYSYSRVINSTPIQNVTYSYYTQYVNLIDGVYSNSLQGQMLLDANGNVYLVTSADNRTCKYTGISLKGAKGDTGSVGANGKDGANGEDGKDGANGKSITNISVYQYSDSEGYVSYILNGYLEDGTAISSNAFEIPKEPFPTSVELNEDNEGVSVKLVMSNHQNISSNKIAISGENSYGSYDIYFKLPTAGAKKITVIYTSQYNYNEYRNEYLNENVVVWENGQPISGFEFTLLAETYTEDNKIQVPLKWINNDTTLDFDFYSVNNYSGYSGVSMTALFKIEY